MYKARGKYLVIKESADAVDAAHAMVAATPGEAHFHPPQNTTWPPWLATGPVFLVPCAKT